MKRQTKAKGKSAGTKRAKQVRTPVSRAVPPPSPSEVRLIPTPARSEEAPLIQRAPDHVMEPAEFKLLLEGVRHSYGFDFRDYQSAWLERRIWDRVHTEGTGTISGLQAKVLHQPASLEALLCHLSPPQQGLFGDPEFYLAVRTRIVPVLRTYPSIQIWLPACGTGEDVYALAILLHEEGLYTRCRIYATDLSEAVFRQAKEGKFPAAAEASAEGDYRQAGGKGRLADYVLRKDEWIVMSPPLRSNIVFLEHQLSTDEVFNEFQLILCRHVWPVLGGALQRRAHRLFRESLGKFGMLAVGTAAAMQPVAEERWYEPIDGGGRLYRKVAA